MLELQVDVANANDAARGIQPRQQDRHTGLDQGAFDARIGYSLHQVHRLSLNNFTASPCRHHFKRSSRRRCTTRIIRWPVSTSRKDPARPVATLATSSPT